MLIKSNYKDYYDWVAGHDTDPRKTFVRDLKVIDNPGDYKQIFGLELRALNNRSNAHYYAAVVWFCDVRYVYLQDINEKIFWYHYGDIPEKVKEEVNKIIRGTPNHLYSVEHLFDIKKKVDYWGNRPAEIYRYNTYLKVPIAFSHYRDFKNELVLNGKLEEIQFNKIKGPAEAFTDIYNWIEHVEPIPDNNPDNKDRLEAKGFDRKTSFRPKMR